MIGALGCIAACASVLGIELPSEQGPIGGVDAAASDGAELEDMPDAPDAAEAGLTLDGSEQESGGEGGYVPCGPHVCTGGFVCCYSTDMHPLGCQSPAECAGSTGRYVACAGPEDCGGNACCVHVESVGQGFMVACSPSTTCEIDAPVACKAADGACHCRPAPNACLPVMTCEGRCM
jgi:hypothetical protein